MAKFIISLNGNPQGEIIIDKDRMTIGRKDENDLAIDNLAISGQHALVLSVMDDVFIEDLGSTNGTYVNGMLIKKQALQNGDLVGIGKHELKFVTESIATLADDFEETVMIKPEAAANLAASSKPIEPEPTTIKIENAAENLLSKKPTEEAQTTPQPIAGKIHILNGPLAGKELNLTKALTTLGKPGVQVAVIAKRPQGYFLTHIEGNKDGEQMFPMVNGESIGAKAYSLVDGDVIELAGIKMAFSPAG